MERNGARQSFRCSRRRFCRSYWSCPWYRNPQKSPECLKCHTTAYDHNKTISTNISTKKSGKARLTVKDYYSCHANTKSYLEIEDHIDNEEDMLTDEVSCLDCHGPAHINLDDEEDEDDDGDDVDDSEDAEETEENLEEE